ncbi:hypothetical protein FOZ62_022397 [Perkinsus olseni]|uniref:Tyr recombinase domain-containing protein n=1 Tax=Perkinsus olseni TaxID=32597 RepID=A0A7J6Q671_PEROL|nr:hypothetical protein FOZ62_022397 [Perkinsus olseni]
MLRKGIGEIGVVSAVSKALSAERYCTRETWALARRRRGFETFSLRSCAELKRASLARSWWSVTYGHVCGWHGLGWGADVLVGPELRWDVSWLTFSQHMARAVIKVGVSGVLIGGGTKLLSELTPRGLSELCCGLAAQGLEDCWQIEAREAEELYDGSGIAARVCTEFRLDPSAKIESIGSMLRDEVEQIWGSDLGKDLDVWISLGREGQLHSDFWDKAKPTLTSCAERLRKKWADVLGVGVRKAAVGGNIRVPLMKAILEAMQEETAEGLDVSYLDEMDRGVVFGCSGPIPISNCWPTKERRSPHGWYPILRDVWDNYASTQSFSGEVAKAIEKEVELGRMVPILPIEESKIRATCRLGCVPSYDGNGNLRKIRVIDDLRRNGVNSIIDGHLKETLLLPTVKCAVALAQRCKESARARGDDTDILWVEGDIRGAFRLIRLAEEDTWWATNSIGGRRYRHLAIPFGGESSPLLFMRFSGSDTKIISRLLRCFDVFHRLMIYIDDKGCPTTRKTARITILVMVLVDLILDVDIAFEKFFCSSTPRVLGFQMDLNKEEVHLPEDKKTAILEALGTLSETSAKVPLALVDKTLGRLVWGSVMFQKLRCQLRPFFSVTKALQKKNHGGGRRKHPVKNISVGVGLASAAQYIHEILQQLCSAPFAGLVPSVGLRRAVVMCDSSTSALGGVIVAPGSVSQDNSPADRQPMEWFHVSLSNEKVQLLVRQYIPSFEVGSRPEPGHMCFLESLAAVIALLSCRRGSGVLVLSDNCAAVCALSKLHGKSEPLDLLMRRLTYLWPGLTTQLMKAVHIEGVSNRVADLISRTDLSTLRELLGHEENMKEINVDGILDDLWPISDGGSSRCQSERSKQALPVVHMFVPSSKCQDELAGVLFGGNGGGGRGPARGRVQLVAHGTNNSRSGAPGVRGRGSFKVAREAASNLSESDLVNFGNHARADSTRKKYDNIRSKYFELNKLAGRDPIPFRAETACVFIISLVRGKYAFETIDQYTRVAKQLAREERGEVISSLEDSKVKLFLRAAEKLSVQAGVSEQRRAATLSAEDVRALASVHEPLTRGIVTGIIVGVAALLRVSELLALEIRDIGIVRTGKTGARVDIRITHSKTDPLWKGCTIAVGCCCTDRGADSGETDDVCPFHRIVPWISGRPADELVFPYERRYFTEQMSVLIGQVLGDKVPVESRVSSHSLRRSGAQLLMDQYVDENRIAEMGRWKNPTCLRERYLRDGTYKLEKQSTLARAMFEGPGAPAKQVNSSGGEQRGTIGNGDKETGEKDVSPSEPVKPRRGGKRRSGKNDLKVRKVK